MSAGGECALDFGPVTLAAGQKMDVTVKTTVPFVGRRLVVAYGHDHAKIHDIKAAGRSQLVTALELPAELFAPSAAFIPMQFDTVQAGREIAITVSSEKGGVFSGALIGTQGEGPGMLEPLEEEAAKAVQEAAEAYEPGVTLDEATGELRGDDT